MVICKRCILPETFPGIKFDERGVCNHCRQEESLRSKSPDKKTECRQKLDSLIEGIKGRSSGYDAIMAYSGGKDSSYALKILRERYDLRTIALTFDNHFISPRAWKNIKTITDNLGVDVIGFRPPWPLIKSLFTISAQQDIFPPSTLLRASSICTGCITIVKSLTIKTALEMSIPLAAYGWSPGQAPIQAAIMKTNPGQMRQNQNATRKAFPPAIANELSRYFLPDSYYESYKDRFPTNIHPLAFFEYDEGKIEDQLGELGWKYPEDTDTNSTNCLLNAFANQVHIDQYGFHPYVLEIANMVRQGVMSREAGVEKIYSEQNGKMVLYGKEKLGL